MEVTNLFSGLLKITVSCNGPYTLQVSGSSPLDFTYQLLDVEDLERGTTRRVVGNPLRGKTIKAIYSMPPAQLFVKCKTAALVSFLARPKPKIPEIPKFLGLSLLLNQTETLATWAKIVR